MHEETFVSLRTGMPTEDNLWIRNSRNILKHTIRGGLGLLVILIFIQVVLYPVIYSTATQTMTANPFVDPNNMTPTELSPCVFPRLWERSSTTDVVCPLDYPYESYCPLNWKCSAVEKYNDPEHTLNFVCLNPEVSCGDLYYCTEFILSTLSFKDYSVHLVTMSTPLFGISYTILIVSGLLIVTSWILFELWVFLISDPFIPRGEDEVPFLGSLVKLYNNVFPIEGLKQCGLNFLVLLPILILVLASGVLFYPGLEPSPKELTSLSNAQCFTTNYFLKISSTTGWSIAFFVTELIIILSIWFFLSLFTIRSFYAIWEPRAFITIVVLIGIVIFIGIFIELVAVLLEAL